MVKSNSQVNIVSEMVKVNIQSGWSNKQVELKSQKNYTEKGLFKTTRDRQFISMVNSDSQSEGLSIVVLIMSLLIWLMSPFIVTGYVMCNIFVSCVNWLINDIKFTRFVDL